MKPETRFRKRVVKFLNTLENTVIFPIQQSSFVGDPDFILCVRGRFVALELKAGDGESEGIQKHKLAKVKKVGKGISILANEENFNSIKETLYGLSNKK